MNRPARVYTRRWLLGLMPSLFCATAVLAEKRDEWILLGRRPVNFTQERDVVPVGLHRGLFTHIRVKAAGNAVRIESLRVLFATGETTELQVRAVIAAGSSTRDIPLPGLLRGIRHVEVVYRRAGAIRPASLSFYGRRVR